MCGRCDAVAPDVCVLGGRHVGFDNDRCLGVVENCGCTDAKLKGLWSVTGEEVKMESFNVNWSSP